MPEFIIGARGHDFGRHTPEELLTSIGKAGFRCTQLAYTKAIEDVKSYADITPELVEATKAAVAASGVSIAVDGTYVELSYADEDKRRAEVAKALSQVPVAKALPSPRRWVQAAWAARPPTWQSSPASPERKRRKRCSAASARSCPSARSRGCCLPWNASTTTP